MRTDALFEQRVTALVEAVDPVVFRAANAIKRDLSPPFKRPRGEVAVE